ncbi:MAG: hypothetical protein J2P15_24080 [Micromonosporaceae bacterium]|nr:hypothetical protein [Micromonosporaceae bacterium]
MRHIGSLIAGIIAAPVAWLLIGWGQLDLAKPMATAAQTGTFHTNDFIKPFVILAVAGIVVGLVASLRLSPVGPLVAGAALVAPYVSLLIAPSYTFRQFNKSTHPVLKQVSNLVLPLTSGLALVLGLVLLVAVLSAARWRRWPKDEFPSASGTSTLTGTTWSSPSWSSTGTDTDSDSSAAGSNEETQPVAAATGSPWQTPLGSESSDK